MLYEPLGAIEPGAYNPRCTHSVRCCILERETRDTLAGTWTCTAYVVMPTPILGIITIEHAEWFRRPLTFIATYGDARPGPIAGSIYQSRFPT